MIGRTKQTKLNLAVSVMFPSCYRVNRHGRKVANVTIFCRFDETQRDSDFFYEAKLRIFPEKKEIKWEFSKKCINAISKAVEELFSEEEICELFEKMENKYQ